MLDDLKMIHERDAQDALGIAEKQYKQLEYEFEISPELKTDNVQKVVYAGMGGSALAALLAKTCIDITLPFEIVRDYTLPEYVDDKTLVIVASYSGNTEETLSSLSEAAEKKAYIAVIAGGGKLADIAKENNYPFVGLPKAEQPRYAVLYNLLALAAILDQSGVTEGSRDKLKTLAPFLKQAVQNWLPTVKTENNPAKKLALELIGSSQVIYSSSLFASIAYKWKISFNENAKNIAWQGAYPEFNHNEFIGWTSHPVEKPYKVIDLRSSFDHPRIQKRFELSDRLLSGRRPKAHVVELSGDSITEQAFWGMVFGDFVTIYVALLNGVNPAPVELVEKLKKELA